MPSDTSTLGVFRSYDGEVVWYRDANGLLQELPPPARDGWRADDRHRALARALDRFGLWNHLGAGARTAAAAEVATGCYPLKFDLLYGFVEFHADGESLAEGGVERFLHEIAPALERHGLGLRVEQIEQPYRWPDHRDYVLSINGLRCVIWTLEEEYPWDASTVRPLATVNQLLAAAGSPVRAHTLYAGANGGLVFLMDPRVADAIRASGLMPDREIPALAVAT